MSKLKLTPVEHFNIRVRKAIRTKITEQEVKEICAILSSTGTEHLKIKFLSIINY